MKKHKIVGVWFVRAFGAPFEHHLFTFHTDGTLLQANPDAGDPVTSDSNGMGVWEERKGKVRGKFVEITANRRTHKFVSRGEINFVVKVDGDSFMGKAEAKFYNEKGILQKGPLSAELKGERMMF